MRYVMADLEARSGLTARTIRKYIEHGFLAPPKGHGLGATYDEEQLLRVVTIARMRAAGEDWDAVSQRLIQSSLASLRAYVRKTDPKPPPPPPEAATPAPPADEAPGAPEPPAEPALEGEPVHRGLPPRHDRRATARGAALEPLDGEDDADLPGGTHFVLAPLMPGLVIMVDRDAPPLVKRVAAEILAKYGVSR